MLCNLNQLCNLNPGKNVSGNLIVPSFILSIAEPHAMIVVESISLDQYIHPGIPKYMYEIRIRKRLKISKKSSVLRIFPHVC